MTFFLDCPGVAGGQLSCTSPSPTYHCLWRSFEQAEVPLESPGQDRLQYTTVCVVVWHLREMKLEVVVDGAVVAPWEAQGRLVTKDSAEGTAVSHLLEEVEGFEMES